MLETYHAHTGTTAHRTGLKLTSDVPFRRLTDYTKQWWPVLKQFLSDLQKLQAPGLEEKAILFAQCVVGPTTGHQHSETRRECHSIPARTLSQTMILKSQHMLFAHLHCLQPNTDNWHSHWARYQQAWSHLEAMALGKEGSKRKHKTLQDWAWRESHICIPNWEVCTDPGIMALLLSLPTGTEPTVLRRNATACF